MQIKLNDVSNMAIPRPPEEEESMEEKAMNGLEIMRVTNQTGYSSLRNILIEKKIYDKRVFHYVIKFSSTSVIK